MTLASAQGASGSATSAQAPAAAKGAASGAPTQANEEEARALFQAASVAYSKGRLDDALELLKRAYALTGRPNLLYSIGITADRLRHDQEAIDAFEAYLDKAPAGEHRAFVQARLDALRARQSKASKGAEGAAQPAAASGSPPQAGEAPAASKAKTKPVPTPAQAAHGSASSAEHAHHGPPIATAEAAPKKEPLTHKWWLWPAVGGGVVVAAVVAGVLIAGSSSGSPAYPPDNVGGPVFALGARP